MTKNEAIESLTYLKEELEDDSPDMFVYTNGNIEALDIGIEAIQKQIPMKPERRESEVSGVYYLCPVCNQVIGKIDLYCRMCGKRLERLN